MDLVLDGRPLAAHRDRIPLFVAAVERLLGDYPWLSAVASARRLVAILYAEYADELHGAEALACLIDAEPAPVRAGLIYFDNTASPVARAAHADARLDASASARAVPWLAAASCDAIDTAVAAIATAARAARAALRCA